MAFVLYSLVPIEIGARVERCHAKQQNKSQEEFSVHSVTPSQCFDSCNHFYLPLPNVNFPPIGTALLIAVSNGPLVYLSAFKQKANIGNN